MKDCARFRPMIGSKDGELSGEEKSLLGGHMKSCDACRAFAADLASTDGLVGRTLLLRANERDFSHFVDLVMARVGEEKTGGSFAGWLRVHRRAVLATLIPALAAAALLLYVRREGEAADEPASLEVATEGEATTVIDTAEGPIVLLSPEES